MWGREGCLLHLETALRKKTSRSTCSVYSLFKLLSRVIYFYFFCVVMHPYPRFLLTIFWPECGPSKSYSHLSRLKSVSFYSSPSLADWPLPGGCSASPSMPCIPPVHVSAPLSHSLGSQRASVMATTQHLKRG